MNDPHVVALFYSIEHDDSIDYSEAQSLHCDDEQFSISVEDQQVRLELKEHYATEDTARKVVEYYIRAWELEAGLRGKPGEFELRFEHAQIVDRNPPPPTPGVVDIGPVRLTLGPLTAQATVSKVVQTYPQPAKLRLAPDDPDVLTMYNRLKGYYENREPLASMAYFCLTMLEKYLCRNRKEAANKYKIGSKVLGRIGNLTANKGGQAARKASGISTDLTRPESRFLEKAVKKIILRVAEVAHDPNQNLPTITLSDLPEISP